MLVLDLDLRFQGTQRTQATRKQRLKDNPEHLGMRDLINKDQDLR